MANQRENQYPEYSFLKLGEVKACGWMKEQMCLDLEKGLAGSYDKISATVSSNLFSSQKQRAGEMITGNHGISQKSWWPGEAEGYWHDGILRMAVLTEHDDFIKYVKSWVEKILKTAEKTGYVGIYTEETRFPAKGFDGELWVQSRVFQALIAWYEYQQDERVLAAIEKTVHKTIDHYRKSTYFGRDEADGGVAHGVGYIDTLEALYRITGDSYYADAAIWLYDDYSNHYSICADIQLENLRDKDKLFYDHTPHAAEALHFPVIAAFFSDNPVYAEAAANVCAKLAKHTNPGGGFIAGDIEAIGGVLGAGSEATEYCSLTESILSLNRFMTYAKEFYCGEWSEVAALNAAQSARFQPANIAVSYLSRDNCLNAYEPDAHGGRELFSASHAAPCCSLNSTRLLPYYMEGMWYRSNQGNAIMANMYGPSEVNTIINGETVSIVEETIFPFSDKITFRLKLEKACKFNILLRIPVNSGTIKVHAGDAEVIVENKLITIRKTWHNNDEISVDFNFKVIRQIQQNGKEAYYQWGVLVFGLPFPVKIDALKELNHSGFFEYALRAESEEGWNYMIDPEADFKVINMSEPDDLHPWANPPISLQGTLLNRKGQQKKVTLLPIGSTLLKRTTFPLDASTAKEKLKTQMFSEDEDPMRLF